MINKKAVENFINPYYKDKDIMHNLWHIELVKRQIDKLIKLGNYSINKEYLYLALCFHGFIYQDEEKIREWLKGQKYSDNDIEQIVKISWESQRTEIPETLEGKILHDAHVLEGGKTYTFVKTLITGSVRGQSLEETLRFMKKNVIGANKCYLPEAIALCDEVNSCTEELYRELVDGIK